MSGGLMTPREVAVVFRVDPKTVTRWAITGRLEYVRTPGGHRRYFREQVEALLRDQRQLYALEMAAELEESRL